MTESHAVAKRADRLSPQQRAQIDEIKSRNTMMQEISSTTWGRGMSPNVARALAEYLRISQTDVTEIDILGGRIYRNSTWYTRRLSEMAEQGEIEYARHRMIHKDQRLEKMAGYAGDDSEQRGQAVWAQREVYFRERERIARGVPENAHVACAWWIKHRDMAEEVTDCKFIVLGRKKKSWKDGKQVEVNADPVGDEHPETTVVSRAFRRTLRYLANRLPHLKSVEARIADEDKMVGMQIGEIRADEAEREARLTPMNRVALVPGGDDPYAETEPTVSQAVEGEPVPAAKPVASEEEDEESYRQEEMRYAED